MTYAAANWMAIIFGIAVFAVIVVTGWRSVQNRRIIRLQSADGHETILVANEGDEITSVVTTTAEVAQPAPSPAPAIAVNTGVAATEPTPVFGRNVTSSKKAI